MSKLIVLLALACPEVDAVAGIDVVWRLDRQTCAVEAELLVDGPGLPWLQMPKPVELHGTGEPWPGIEIAPGMIVTATPIE